MVNRKEQYNEKSIRNSNDQPWRAQWRGRGTQWLDDMKITPPGIHAEGTNPEQLFAAGYASCFNGAVQHMIKEAGMTAESTVKARVSLYNLDDGGYQIGVVLEVHIDGISEEEAQKIAEDAHEFCPYSKATRGNIDVEVTIV